MSDAPSTPITSHPQPRPRRAGFHPIFLIFLSAVATTCGCLASRGNGWPPFTYVLSGGIIVPLLADWTAQRLRSARTASLLIVFLGGAATFVTAYRTSRPPPDDVFEEIFGIKKPADIRDLRTRVQWFDGRISLATFVATDTTFEMLAQQGDLKSDPTRIADPESPEQLENRWFIAVGQWGSMAYDFWPSQKRVPSLDVREKYGDPDHPWQTTVARDPVTGQVWAARLQD